MSKEELKAACEELDLGVGGNKPDLLERLEEHFATKRGGGGGGGGGSKGSSARAAWLAGREDISDVSKEELKAACEELDVGVGGNKPDLLERLEEHFATKRFSPIGGSPSRASRWPHAPLTSVDFSALADDPESKLASEIKKGHSEGDKSGYVYAFLSDAAPANAIKVGFTEDPKARFGQHRACYGDLVMVMEEVNMIYEKLAESAVHAILGHYGQELHNVKCANGHENHREWFVPPKGVSLGVWRDSVRNAIEWVSRNVRDGARGKR